MNIEDQKAHFENLIERSRQILFSKGNDYANTDRLSNFKLAGTICGLNPEMNCLSLIATKVARLGVLLNSGKEPDNEGVRDSVIDLVNYGVLLDMILGEKVKSNAINIMTTRTKSTFPIVPPTIAEWDADGVSHNPNE